MPTRTRAMSLLSAALGLSSITRLLPGCGVVMMPLKFLSTAFAPWIALLGGVSLSQGLRKRDRLATVAGAVGLVSAGLCTQAMLKRRPDPLAEAFGADWRQRLPAERRQRLDRPARGVRCERNITIGKATQGGPLRADLWLPPTHVPPSGAALIYLHGSAWYYFSKALVPYALFKYLAGQGHVILNVGYTLAPHANLADMLAEVRQAQRWMQAHGPRYGVDATRLVLGGASAGAHLALLAAYTAARADEKARGVIAWYGVSDLFTEHEHLRTFPHLPENGCLHRLVTWLQRRLHMVQPGDQYVNAADLLPRLIGATLYDAPYLYELWSPLSYVGPDSPPTLLLHGQMDAFVPTSQSRYLRAALRRYGVPVALCSVPYADHDFDLIPAPLQPALRATQPVVAGFMALMSAL